MFDQYKVTAFIHFFVFERKCFPPLLVFHTQKYLTDRSFTKPQIQEEFSHHTGLRYLLGVLGISDFTQARHQQFSAL